MIAHFWVQTTEKRSSCFTFRSLPFIGHICKSSMIAHFTESKPQKRGLLVSRLRSFMSQFLKILHDCSFESNHRRKVSLPPLESLRKSQCSTTTWLLIFYSVQATEEVSLFLVWVPSSVTAKSLSTSILLSTSLYGETPTKVATCQHLPLTVNSPL